MVLIGLVAGVIGMFVVQSGAGFSEAKATSNAMAQAAEAADRLGGDLRAARSLGRSGTLIDPADLKQSMHNNGTLVDLMSGDTLDWQDVTQATANSITFQSDVIDQTSGAQTPECVRWYVDGTTTWSLRRTVRPYSRGCSAPTAASRAVLEDDHLTNPTSTAARPGSRGVPPLFAYVISTAGRSGCTSAVISSPTSVERNRIVAVRLDVRSLVIQHTSASRAALLNEVGIRSRSSSDYQFAMGCAA